MGEPSAQGTVATLLRGNPAYSDALAEQVLQHYLRIHLGYVKFLVYELNIPYEDVEQEIRIALWRQWTRYQHNSRVTLQQWLSWRIRHAFKSLVRKHLQRSTRLPVLSLDAILEDKAED